MTGEAKTESARPAQLRVSHPAAANVMGRGLKLTLDGEELPHLSAGRNLTVRIEPGRHRLRADNTYQSKAVEFDAESGEQVHYRITNRAGFFGALIITMLGAGPIYLLMERVEPVESSSAPTPPTPSAAS